MAQADGEVKWYDREFLLVVDGASDDLLTRLAFQGEAHAKVNVTEAGAVDTGFMRSAIYGIGPDANHRTLAEVGALAAADRSLVADRTCSVAGCRGQYGLIIAADGDLIW